MLRMAVPSLARCFSTTTKVDVKLVGKLRQQYGLSMKLCKEALIATAGDINKAGAWLEEEQRKLGNTKLEKLGDRVTACGLVAVYGEGHSTVLVEVNSETDFVSRNENFRALVQGVCRGAIDICKKHNEGAVAFDPEEIMTAPVAGSNVKNLVADLVGKVGENIKIARACGLNFKGGEVGAYAHGDTNEANELGQGLRAGLVALQGDSRAPPDLARRLAQHVVGMDVAAGKEQELLDQPFVFQADLTISELLLQHKQKLHHYNAMKVGEAQ